MLGIVRAKSRLLIILNFGFSAVAATVVLLLAVASTGIVVAARSTIGSLGSAFSLNVQEGGPFLAIVWVAAVLGSAAASYWFSTWFVEVRKSAFSRRSRTTNQVGNWRGILGEVRRDVKLDGHFATSDGYREHGVQEAAREK